MAIHAYESVLVIPMTESNKPLPPFTLPQPEPPKLTLWVDSYDEMRRATLDDLRAVLPNLSHEEREAIAEDVDETLNYINALVVNFRMACEPIDKCIRRLVNEASKATVMIEIGADRDEWKRRAEKAEARVAELQAQLQRALNAAADARWDLLP